MELVALIPHHGAPIDVFGEDLDPIFFESEDAARVFLSFLPNRDCVEFHIMTKLDHGGWVF